MNNFNFRWLGKKHGEGLIVYNEPSKGHNFYKGQWQNGEKEGFGYRQYPSGAKYIGFWSNGKRHGKGVMFWKNNDVSNSLVLLIGKNCLSVQNRRFDEILVLFLLTPKIDLSRILEGGINARIR